MGFFKQRKKIVDWTERMQRQQEKIDRLKAEMTNKSLNSSSNSSLNSDSSNSSQETTPFPFFAGIGADSSNSSNSSYENSSDDLSIEERRRRLSKRLLDMTNKIEELSNSIYQLQQRIEVLERKSGLGNSRSNDSDYDF